MQNHKMKERHRLIGEESYFFSFPGLCAAATSNCLKKQVNSGQKPERPTMGLPSKNPPPPKITDSQATDKPKTGKQDDSGPCGGLCPILCRDEKPCNR